VSRVDIFRKLAPKLGAVEGRILTKRAKALHWLLFPIMTFTWWLSEKNGFCVESYSIAFSGKKISIISLMRISDGKEYKIKCVDGQFIVEASK